MLMKRLETHGIHLHHIVLTGDHRLFTSTKGHATDNISSQVEKVAHDILEWIYLDPDEEKNSSSSREEERLIELQGVPLQSKNSTIPQFPRSLLLVGPSLQTLKVTQCQLKDLPVSFGLYFPNLLVISIHRQLMLMTEGVSLTTQTVAV